MTSNAPLYAGLLVGLSVAAPVGPMGLLCIRRTLDSGMRAGVCTGLGAATVNVVYGAGVLLGLDWLAPALAGSARLLNAGSGVFLLWSAVRVLRRRTDGAGPAAGRRTSAAAAYGTAVAFNAANPLSAMLILALLTPLARPAAASAGDAAALLLGLFAAAAAWWVCLAGLVALLRSRLSPAVLAHVNHAAGLVLSAYGLAALARSAGM